jgi:hypothetical protein
VRSSGYAVSMEVSKTRASQPVSKGCCCWSGGRAVTGATGIPRAPEGGQTSRRAVLAGSGHHCAQGDL